MHIFFDRNYLHIEVGLISQVCPYMSLFLYYNLPFSKVKNVEGENIMVKCVIIGNYSPWLCQTLKLNLIYLPMSCDLCLGVCRRQKAIWVLEIKIHHIKLTIFLFPIMVHDLHYTCALIMLSFVCIPHNFLALYIMLTRGRLLYVMVMHKLCSW